MRLSLAAASEAENSAVMSTRDQDAKTFAEEARTAEADLELGRIELGKLLKGSRNPGEPELMERVSQSMLEFQKIHKQLLDLAMQNSNRKAFGMAFGPATKLLEEMNEALSQIVAKYADSTAENRFQVTQLANDVRIGILSTQVVLLPHIAEASDQKMDQFEVQLSELDRKIRENLAALKLLSQEDDQADIDRVTSRYEEFDQLKSQIITLSRQNTDLRAVTIALQEKRQAMLACQDALVALEHAILAEPMTSTIPSRHSP
jgi:uncharacterized protein (UPF0210 family)